MTGWIGRGWARVGRWGRWRVGAAVVAVLLVASIVGAATAGRTAGPSSGAPAVQLGTGPTGIHSSPSTPAPGSFRLGIAGPAGSASGASGAPVGGAGGGAGSGGVAASGEAGGVAVGAPSAAASAGSAGSPGGVTPVPVPPPNPGTGQVSTLAAPKVVENASVALTVGHGSLNNVVDQFTALASADGGIVSHADQSTTSDGVPGASMTLRVPDAQFASALARIKSTGKVTSIQSSGDDVTSQYVDLQSRIHALQASRDQYLQILSRASAIGDVLAVQNQLDGVQSQLEQLQGQLNVLDDQTTYSTIQVAIVEALPAGRPDTQPKPASGLARAWHRAAAAFTGGLDWLVGASGALGFAVLLVAGLAVVGRLGWALVGRWRRGSGVGPATPAPTSV